MAGRLWGTVETWARTGMVGNPRGPPATTAVPSRRVTVSRTGTILPKPVKMPFGLLRVFAVVIPFLYVGTQISKSFAALLEEHDIFVPEDDDDDD
ncbi:essential MCU regulator, mitochondrial [Pogona vitticeps]|uniref:Essential MCU regulator, mitochondrial n=1 Tax=Pogona vitticeps TaxID=103695 RepID=A0A6J0T4M8_9SAUR